MNVPSWKVEVYIVAPLTPDKLDELVSALSGQEAQDSLAPSATGYLMTDGASLRFTLGALDEAHAAERGHRIVRDNLEHGFVTGAGISLDVSLISGTVEPRDAFQHHISSSITLLNEPFFRLDGVRQHIETALRYADVIGQETDGLRTMIGEVEALREMAYDASKPLVQRLAEVEVRTRG
jgi:hypothetical protein